MERRSLFFSTIEIENEHDKCVTKKKSFDNVELKSSTQSHSELPPIRANNLAGYEKLIEQHRGSEVSTAAKQRRLPKIFEVSPKIKVKVSSSSHKSKHESMDKLYSIVSSSQIERISRAWADAIISDRVAFSMGSSPDWKDFWKIASGGAWKPPYGQTIYGPSFDHSFE